jgi:hypothetical protein
MTNTCQTGTSTTACGFGGLFCQNCTNIGIMHKCVEVGNLPQYQCQ